MAVGRWWKFTSDQLHDGSRTEAQRAKTFKKGILGFLYSSFLLLLPSGRPRGGLLFLLFSLGNGITCRKEGARVQEIVVYEFTHNGTNA